MQPQSQPRDAEVLLLAVILLCLSSCSPGKATRHSGAPKQIHPPDFPPNRDETSPASSRSAVEQKNSKRFLSR